MNPIDDDLEPPDPNECRICGTLMHLESGMEWPGDGPICPDCVEVELEVLAAYRDGEWKSKETFEDADTAFMTSVHHDLNRKIVVLFFEGELVARMSPDEALRIAKGLETAARAIEDAEYDTAGTPPPVEFPVVTFDVNDKTITRSFPAKPTDPPSNNPEPSPNRLQGPS